MKVYLIAVTVLAVLPSFAQSTAEGIWGAIWALPTLTKSSGSEKIDTTKRISGRCQVQSNSSLDKLCRQIQLKLLDKNGIVIQTTWTDSSGFFVFIDIPKGEYSIDPGFSNFQINDNGNIKPGGEVAMQISE